MRVTARLGKRNLIRLPNEVIQKLKLKEGDIIVFDIGNEIKVFKVEV